MIHIFRKEMKKWHTVLWVVVVAFAVSGTSMMFFKGNNLAKIKVATINGFPVSMKRYRQAFFDIQHRVNELQKYAKLFGTSVQDMLLEFFGKSSVSDIALDSCIREALLDQMKEAFDVRMGSDFFQEELVKNLPEGIIDERGRVNMNSYQAFLRGRALSLADFESLKEDEFKRNLISRFIADSYYVPAYKQRDDLKHASAQKGFDVVVFPYDNFLKKVKETAPSDKKLKNFFNKHKERYRVPEYRKAQYWQISAKGYAKKISVSEKAIKHFYEKNKSSKFRIPPKIKVRHIFIKEGDDALKKAKKFHEQVKEKPESFADLAAQNSDDKKTAVQGGLTKLFDRGTFDADFEQAAFRLYKKGDLSDIVKTTDGFQIIQLEERIKADYKPLDDVKEEIVKVLTAKKALSRLKSDLEVMRHNMKSSDEAMAKFVQENKLTQMETKNLSKNQDSSDVEGRIAKRIFSPYKRQSNFGYFFFDEKYVLYKHSDTQKSFIRPLTKNKDEVLKYYYKKEAKELLKEAIRQRLLKRQKSITLRWFR